MHFTSKVRISLGRDICLVFTSLKVLFEGKDLVMRLGTELGLGQGQGQGQGWGQGQMLSCDG